MYKERGLIATDSGSLAGWGLECFAVTGYQGVSQGSLCGHSPLEAIEIRAAINPCWQRCMADMAVFQIGRLYS